MRELIRVARTWMDVPYLHQGRNRFGADCVGFPLGVYRECGVTLPDWRAYGEEADPDELIARLREALGHELAVAPVAREAIQVGDVIVFRFPKTPQPRHIAFVADYALGGFSFIESNGNYRRVIERRLDDRYLSHVTHVFRRPV